ncbi:MAG: HAD hydrolase-like protein [Candidatus Kerfeldbacteria bacterium]|nr:HAD hydrolase-like protein [Candidatus Kerfeldbacteria bacterium]
MVDKVIFDTDGLVIQREMYFSARLSKDFGVAPEKVLQFFKHEFKQCLIGKADAKEELKKYAASWNWTGTIEQLLEYWFKSESTIDQRIIQTVQSLSAAGIHCYLDTNNERYRTEYLRQTLGLGKVFDAIFSSSLLGCAKPAVEFWQAIHKQLGEPDKATVMVWDDEKESVKSARGFGFQAELYLGFGAFQKVMQSRLGFA